MNIKRGEKGMRTRKFVDSITFRLSTKQRAAVEKMADREELSIGEAARMLLNEGIKARELVA
jgi:hypothetical protein